MRINHNIAALNTHRQMGTANANQSKSMEKLSSGLRINRAGDDAAGLAISEKMRAQIRGLDQAATNAQDGISMIQTTEGALNETHSILQRMRELATQSANDTNTKTDRGEIQKEMNQLTSEINRIGNTTEFNTQSLLKGKDAPVVEETATVTTEKAGESGGTPTGALTGVTTVTNSVVGKASTASVQASTSVATGTVSKMTEVTASVKAEKATVSLANGVKFEAATTGTALNTKNITIVQSATAGATSYSHKDAVSGNYTITIGQTSDGKSLASNRGELFNQITSALVNGKPNADGTGISTAITDITVKQPGNTAEALGPIASNGTFAGGKVEAEGTYEFTLEKKFTEAGDTIEVNGKTYKAVIGTPAADNEFTIGADAAGVAASTTTTQAASLAAAIALVEPALFSTATSAGGKITLTEDAATGKKLANPVAKGTGQDAKLNLTNKNGQNLKTVTLSQHTADTLSVTQTGGNLSIALAKDTAAFNSLEKISEAIKALGNAGGIDFTQFEITAEGNWNGDANILGNALTKPQGTFVGGTVEVKGEYNFDIDKAFAVGDLVEIKGQSFKAVAGTADTSKGEFSIDGDKGSQAAELADAISLNDTLKDKFTTTASGSKITLKEVTPTGKDVKASDLALHAIGIQGEFSMKVEDLLANGGKFKLDGQEIKVSDKEKHAGYEAGTAIKVAATPQEQVAALAEAINKNADLKGKYEASVSDSGELVLKQTEKNTIDKAPELATATSPLGDFTASFQVGANANQSMTIEVGDMRSGSLGVAGDGSEGTIMSSDGKVASYVEVAGVTNGTTNTNTEFALDISSHDKATAAISVINDAIEKVSAQRSNLGAYQNRLDHTINNLGTSSENLTAAESRIRDVDMAKEMMNQTKESILAQASQAMLAQANQKPQSVLQLLG